MTITGGLLPTINRIIWLSDRALHVRRKHTEEWKNLWFSVLKDAIFRLLLSQCNLHSSVADPGFPRWGRNLFLANFSENCMKIKEIRPRGGAYIAPSLDPPLVMHNMGSASVFHNCNGFFDFVMTSYLCLLLLNIWFHNKKLIHQSWLVCYLCQ